MKTNPYILAVIILSFFNLSNGQIISYELIKNWPIEEIGNLYSEYNIPESVGEINYSVDGYKVMYLTPDYDGSMVICSGAIYIPVNIGCEPPILSWSHGTISKKSSAPSNIGNTSNDLIGVLCASHGYITLMSDLIGLGEGEGLHNYVHAKTEASATIDLILYGKQLSSELLGISPNDELFLFGYSQGGHTTMATVKEIEKNYSEELQITASAPMAGPYDMSGVMKNMMNSGQPYPNPGYLPYVLFSYNKIYNLYDNINEVLIPPYNSTLFDMYDGTNSMWTINYILPEIPINIFWASYYQDFITNTEHPMNLALIDNNVYNFTPQSPMKLLHCSGDDNVDFENSTVAYNYFIENGAQNIELMDGGNFNHSDCAFPAIIGAKTWFDSMANLCETTGFYENSSNKNELIYNIDFLGRTLSKEIKNKNMISIYENGIYEKKLIINN